MTVTEQITQSDKDPASKHYPQPFPIRIIAGLIRRVRLRWLLLTHPTLKIGKNVNIRFNDVRFTTKWGHITIGDNSQIIAGNLFADLTIGKRVNLMGAIKLGGSGKYKVTIGDDTWIAPNVYICPSTHCFKDKNRTIKQQGVHGGNITIGNDCWIGVNVVISPGITIGNGAVIGANAVVTKDIPDYAVAVGIPARVITYRK